MPEKKRRVPIPSAIAARVLFDSDRRCCICREAGKRVQIHHIDENPAHNEIANLATLCYDCHDLTQVAGGFGRKLDADQVILYRDDWVRYIALQRRAGVAKSDIASDISHSVELATSLAEIYRDNEQWTDLAIHYNTIGNIELRDKWIEKALSVEDVDTETMMFLRGMQGRPDLIPSDLAERRLAEQVANEDWSQRARALVDLDRWKEAVVDYMKAVMGSLEGDRLFTAAFYLKELSSLALHQKLFLEDYARERELWWRVRALQELGWDDERRRLLLEHEDQIKSEGNPLLLVELAWAGGDPREYVEARKELEDRTRGMRVVSADEEDEDA